MTTSYAHSRPEAQSSDLVSIETLRLLTDFNPDVTLLAHADARCRHATQASAWVLGRSPADLVGTDVRELAIEADREALNDLFLRLNTGEIAVMAEFRVQHSGQTYWVEVTGRRLPGAHGAVLCLRDISTRKQGEAVMEEANSLLRHRAAIDTVTGVLNRDHLVATLERELRRAQRERTELAVITVSLTEFRRFTDLYGWEAADAALQAVAGAIGSALQRPADMVGRLDSDEFAVVLPSTGTEGASVIAERIVGGVQALAIPHAGLALGQIGAVTGIALSTPGCDVLGLLRDAHCAMRSAKGEPIGTLLHASAA